MLKTPFEFFVFFLVLFMIPSCVTPRSASSQSPAETVQKVPAQKPIASQGAAKKVVPDLASDIEFQRFLTNNATALGGRLEEAEALNLQIIFTEIKRSARNIPSFTTHYFNKGGTAFTYTAQAIGLPVAILALQKLNTLSDKGINAYTTMITEALITGQRPAYNDPNTSDGLPNISQYIKRLLLTGDEAAFDKLYEFVGPDYIKTALAERGYDTAEIIARMDEGSTANDKKTSTTIFYDRYMKQLYRQPIIESTRTLPLRNETIGKKHVEQGRTVSGGLYAGEKNRVSLVDLHTMLQTLLFPQAYTPNKRFVITEADRIFLLSFIYIDASKSLYPTYPNAIIFSSNYLLPQRQVNNNDLKLYNISGKEYGQLTDVVYYVDVKSGREFLLSSSIYCNENDIVGDGVYNYDAIGKKFMQALSTLIYDKVKLEKVEVMPDFSDIPLAIE